MKQARQGVTRRAVATAVLAVPASAAQPPAVDDAQAARARAKQNSEQLRRFKVPQLLEPSFAFRP